MEKKIMDSTALPHLVYMIGRLFYTDKYIILLDMLAEERVYSAIWLFLVVFVKLVLFMHIEFVMIP